jgi:membrane protease YdiL (CAAX protease family)
MAEGKPKGSFKNHWKGHLFLFGKGNEAPYPAATGNRMLLIFLVLEGAIGPKLTLLRLVHLAGPPPWIRVPALLLLALMLVRWYAKVQFRQLGLRRWNEWNGIEKSYFVQVLVIAIAVFVTMSGGELRMVLAREDVWSRVWKVFLPYLVWGFYQELVYRGILQTELVRRWGAWVGILVGNCLFTFGPLHSYHYWEKSPHWPVFTAIFSAGLFFSALYWRSRNLWMVGALHGIGNVFMDGLATK